MTEQAIKKIIDRKNIVHKKQDELNTQYSDAGIIRQMILSSRGDSLSNEHLILHRSELRIRKFISNIIYVLPLAAFAYFKTGRSLVFSLIPSFILSNNFYKYGKISKYPSDYSYSFAERSMKEFYGNILLPNFKKIASPEDKWNSSKNQIPHKEWIERNDYK
jgi:hypothetical protein